MQLEIKIPGQPVPCPRPRVSDRGTYYPKKYKDWKKQAVKYLAFTCDVKGIEACSISITFIFQRLKTQRQIGRIPKTTRPDIDNLCKAVFDALQESGILADDGKIWSAHVDKYYAAIDEQPRIEITISR
tara:strand:+ start:2898 stop:3284 length:387 start_codon:yes stop_codon:yes gene_type:complete